MSEKYVVLTRAALLLTLTLLFQSLRFFIPVPAFISTFLIGSLVNACLLIAMEVVGLRLTFAIAAVTPIIAYLQQLLPLPIFIIPVALGNAVYVWIFSLSKRRNLWLNIVLSALTKSIVLYITFSWLLTFIAIPAKLAASLLFIMSWPQFITGLIGGILASSIKERLQLLQR